MTRSTRIRDIGLKNFKAFPSLRLHIGDLTVLTGTNSSGKSSVMQAIALLEQSRDQEPAGLVLNGNLVELGVFEDVLFDRIDPDRVNDQAIEISARAASGRWERYGGTAASQSDFIQVSKEGSRTMTDSLPWSHLFYVRADRIGPTLLHQKSYTTVVRQRDIGSRGEFAAHFLLSYGDTEVHRRLCLPGVPQTLEDQVGAWLERLSVDTRLYVSDVEATGTAVMRFSNGPVTGLSSGRLHRSTNVGFGLSYTLPIIVVCLMARRGDLLLIENPEAHLHPRGQAVLAELCAAAAAAGAQVVVETHSDHVLNGLRIAVAQNRIEAGAVALYYFSRTREAAAPAVARLEIDSLGRIDAWPDGFFDEYLNALLTLNDAD